ncbi:hypothetical protein GGR51DRAFT_557833 [Nemania sp. FL0031]|nr:hypothetical protein GGR51DRAFT_557833 [Nemania sp. FL0031]
MPADPSQPPPILDQADYDDIPNPTYIPSLTGSGSTIDSSTADSVSVFSETLSQLTSDKSSYQPLLKSVKHSCPHSFKTVRAGDSHKDLTCQRCKAKLDQLLLECNYCAIQQCKSCQHESQFEKIRELGTGMNKTSRLKYLETVFFSKPKSREVVLQSVDALIGRLRTSELPPGNENDGDNDDPMLSLLPPWANESQTRAGKHSAVSSSNPIFWRSRRYLLERAGLIQKGQELTEEDIENIATLPPLIPEEVDEQFYEVSSRQSGYKQIPKREDSMVLYKDTKPYFSHISNHQSVEDSSDTATDGEYSSTSSSDESSITTIGIAGIQKEEIVNSIILSITKWLRSRFIQLRKAADGPTDGSCKGGSAPSAISEQFSQGQAQPARKRRARDKYDDSAGDDGDDSNGCPDSGTDNKGKGRETQRFACPYFKYNPTKYQHWSICPGPGWMNVHRLKEHLYRKHRQAKFRCMRCWERFESEQDCFNHQRAAMPCELGEREPTEGFDAAQETQLRSRKKKGHPISEIDKWRAVFQILFPHVPADQIPSPFYEYEQLTSPATPAHEALTKCEEYVLCGLALQLREILTQEFERDWQIIGQSLQQQAVESAKTIVANLFQEFRTLQQQDRAPTTMSGPSESQSHAGPSSSDVHPSQPGLMGSHNIIFDAPEFDLDFLLGADGSLSLFQGVLLEDIPRALTDPENSALKQSDSGYGSNNQERPDEQATDLE